MIPAFGSQPGPAPIAYDIDGAARAISVSRSEINRAISAGDLTPRYRKSKPLIGHAELAAFFEALPVGKPEKQTP